MSTVIPAQVGSDTLTLRRLCAYGTLNLALAFAFLPVYLLAPEFYAREFGLSLALLGQILLAVRIFDGIQDPLLGLLSDRLNRSPSGRYRFIAFALPLLALGFWLLFAPPDIAAIHHAVWFAGALMLVSSAYSAVLVAYTAVGAEVSGDYHERTRISAFREGFGLIGVLLTAALAHYLAEQHGMREGYRQLAVIFLLLLSACAAVTLFAAPRPLQAGSEAHGFSLSRLYAKLRNPFFARLLLIYLLTGLAAGVPMSLFLFYVKDVIAEPHHSDTFLLIYFLSGAVGMPFWSYLSRRFSKKTAWGTALVVSIVTFLWAYGLSAHALYAYAAICCLSGLYLGANLVLPASILADIIGADKQGGGAAYFGLWALANKLSFALAAGISLPLVAYFGYTPGATNAGALHALSASYALLPCAIQLCAAFLLWKFRVEPDKD